MESGRERIVVDSASDTQTDRQMDGSIDRNRNRNTDVSIDRYIERNAQIDRERARVIYRYRKIQIEIKIRRCLKVTLS